MLGSFKMPPEYLCLWEIQNITII